MRKLRWIDSEDVGLKSYYQEPVRRVSQRARGVLDLLTRNTTGAVDREQFRRICRGLRKYVTDPAAYEVITNELSAVVGCAVSPAERARLACSLAGAVAAARRSSTVGLLSSQVDPLVVWAVIRDVEQQEDVTGEFYLHWKLLICNSVLAGCEIFTDVLVPSGRRWAKQLGLLGPKFKPYGYHTGLQFMDAVLLIRVEKRDNQIELLGGGVNPSVLQLNRKLGESRSRKASACHLGARHDCGSCLVGRNQCARSVIKQETDYELESE